MSQSCSGRRCGFFRPHLSRFFVFPQIRSPRYNRRNTISRTDEPAQPTGLPFVGRGRGQGACSAFSVLAMVMKPWPAA